MLGRRRHLVKGTVDAVADLELVFEGFEVDVRSAVLHRLHEDEIDELHHGDVVDRIVQGDGHAFGCVVFLRNFPVAAQFLEQGGVTEIGLRRVELLDARRHLGRVGHDHL